MSARTAKAARTTIVLAAAALANSGLLSLLLLDSAQRAASAPPSPPDIRIELAPRTLARPPPTVAPAAVAAKTASAPGRDGFGQTPPAETEPVREEPHPARSAPPAAAAAAAPQTLGAAEPDEEPAASRAAAALLRRLRDCSGQASAERELQAKCAGSRGSPAFAGLTPERRADFDSAAGRGAEQMDTAAHLQRNTFAPPLDGSVARFGCVFSGGKRRCGAY